MVHCATEPGACALSQDAVEASEDGTRTCGCRAAPCASRTIRNDYKDASRRHCSDLSTSADKRFQGPALACVSHEEGVAPEGGERSTSPGEAAPLRAVAKPGTTSRR